MIVIKPGVKLQDPRLPGRTINSVWGVALPIVAAAYAYYGKDCVITSAFDGTHMPNSLHYIGRALDFRTHTIPVKFLQALRAKVADALGSEFDVVLEKDHLHVEYQPKVTP